MHAANRRPTRRARQWMLCRSHNVHKHLCIESLTGAVNNRTPVSTSSSSPRLSVQHDHIQLPALSFHSQCDHRFSSHGSTHFKMKAIVVKEFYSSLSELHVSSIPQPTPSSSSILIKVLAAGVNFVDTLYARGKHQNNRSLVLPPFVLGLEFAGVVVSAPPESSWKPGDRVFGDHSGSYAEYLTVTVEIGRAHV